MKLTMYVQTVTGQNYLAFDELTYDGLASMVLLWLTISVTKHSLAVEYNGFSHHCTLRHQRRHSDSHLNPEG